MLHTPGVTNRLLPYSSIITKILGHFWVEFDEPIFLDFTVAQQSFSQPPDLKPHSSKPYEDLVQQLFGDVRSIYE